ncbi:MAG TPA: NAD(P)/FAD-dependent oxidoreductase [Thermoanaerobaculia bacterium]
MEVKTDVAIIGGGPAGSTLAALLARKGIGVALIDRDTFPRDKLCGEFLSYDALPILDRLGVNLDTAPQISRCRVISRRATYEFEFPRAARGVSRMLLDALLFRMGVERGAHDLSGWTAVNLSRDGVEAERGEERIRVTARVVAGAWGRWGRFDTQLGRAFVRDRSHRNFGFKRHYRAAQSLATTIDLHSFDRGYLGVSPIENGLTNICGLVHASRLAGHKGRWDAFVDEIRREEPVLDAMYARHEPDDPSFLSSEPVIFRARSPVEGGVVMVGDASGVIDPLTGNGMAMAIQSALVAAPHIVRMLDADRTSAETSYVRAHRQFFAPRIRWSRRVARLLSHPALLDAGLRVVKTPRAGAFLLRHTRGDDATVERLAAEWF